MTRPVIRNAARCLFLLAFLACAACATTGGGDSEPEPPIAEMQRAPPVPDAPMDDEKAQGTQADDREGGEVPLVVAETEQREKTPPAGKLPEVVVEARERHVVIHDLVAEAQALLRDVELEYAFAGSGSREVLRGRPVAFALWSEAKKAWSIVHIEIPRPPIKWKPGAKPLPFVVRTPGIQAQHVKGTGAERLMFAFSRGGEPLKVYGRKFPVFDNALIKKKQWRDVVRTATPIVYLPFTEDTLDQRFVSDGREFLLATARKAIEDLRLANAPSAAFAGERLADVIPAEVITTLAVIEQTDDADYMDNQSEAVNDVLSQYGLKREEAFRYSVSSASALGPMQFTDRRGNGTYSLVVRRCPGARLDPSFERGATNLRNVMKAAICLLDLELSQMPGDIRNAYRDNRDVMGIFPVAAYNGGPRNVAKLYRVLRKMGLQLEDLRRPDVQSQVTPLACPCFWRADGAGARPVTIPKYNNENRWYVEKYQTILHLFE